MAWHHPGRKKLLVAVQKGDVADYRTGNEEVDNPEKADSWGPERTIRAGFIRWLCIDKEATELVHFKGVQVSGAKVEGDLDFEAAVLPRRLGLFSCALSLVVLMDAQTQAISLDGSTTGPINADRLVNTKGNVFLRGVKAKGEVRLLGAVISGDLSCNGAQFENEGGKAFTADRLVTKGSVFLNGVKAKGEVRLLSANIGGSLDCLDAELLNKDGTALNADKLAINGSVFLRGDFNAIGEVNFSGAKVGSNFDCNGAKFENKGGKAINADTFTTKGNVLLSRSKVAGEVCFVGADVGGGLYCVDARFDNESGFAFIADGLAVKGAVFFRGAKAKGEVRLIGANIGGGLECDGAQFDNEGGRAFNADGFAVKGAVFFRGAKAKGEVKLLGADIGANLECNGAQFENEGGNALSADGTEVGGSVFLGNDFKAVGEVRLLAANIGNQLSCIGALFVNEGLDDEGKQRIALNAKNTNITGGLLFRDMKGLKGVLELTDASVGNLQDDGSGWPDKGSLFIDCFEYGGLTGNGTIRDAKRRINWLQLQPTVLNGEKVFFPQPYEQLAKVFRNMGLEADAREVLIVKQEDLRKYGKLSWDSWAWNLCLGIFIRHGYSPLPLIATMTIIVGIGWRLYLQAYKKDLIKPSKPEYAIDGNIMGREMFLDKHKEYPRFKPLLYSLENFIPGTNFHHKDYWELVQLTKYAKRTWYFMLFQMAFGWFCTLVIIAYVTGIVSKG